MRIFEIGTTEIRAGEICAIQFCRGEIGTGQHAVDQHRIREVGTASSHASHVRAGEISRDETRPAKIDGVVIWFFQPHIAGGVALGNDAITHVGILQARTGQIGAT